MTRSEEVVLVACCGQEMAGDDAFGLHVARQLRTLGVAGAKTVTLGARPADLLDHLPGPAAMIVVDAVRDPSSNPGQLVDLDWFDPARPPLAHEKTFSSHGLSIADQIDLARQLGVCPSTVQLVGCTIGDVRVGQAMDQVVRRQVSVAADRVMALIETFTGQRSGAGSQS